MLNIDGSQGEGGGQIVRSSIALACVTATPVTITNIRAGRKKPGLMRQHLTAVGAAAEISDAKVEGAAIGSSCLSFQPGDVSPGQYSFRVGTAGSATLVLQTVLPALLLAEAPSTLMLEGGTHNLLAPPFDFLEKSYLPLVHRAGPQVNATLERPGFYPAGGGRVHVNIHPAGELVGFDLLERGKLVRRGVRALVSNLPKHVGQRECDTIARKSGWGKSICAVEQVESNGPGNVVMIEIESDAVTEVFTGFGKQGVRAERVATDVWKEARDYLATDVPVGPYLADQLLLPMGLAAHRGSPSSFRTMNLTPHTTTHIDVLRTFLDVKVDVREEGKNDLVVQVAPSA